MVDLTVATYNLGNASQARVIADLRRLLGEAAVIGTCETGDRGAEVAAVNREPGVDVLRKPNGGANRLSLVLNGITQTAWGVFPLNPGGERVERAVPGNSDGTAEAKFILWADVNGARVGETHLIPSTGRRLFGRWRFPKAREVYKTQVARAVEWFAQGGDVLVGDINAVPSHDLLDPLRKVAECHAVPSHGDRAIDHVWVRKGSGITVADIRALGGYSSDHRPVVAVLRLPSERATTGKSAEDRAAGLIRTKLLPTVERAPVAALLEAAAAAIQDGSVKP